MADPEAQAALDLKDTERNTHKTNNITQKTNNITQKTNNITQKINNITQKTNNKHYTFSSLISALVAVLFNKVTVI
jgi:uncharacterized protein YoxC